MHFINMISLRLAVIVAVAVFANTAFAATDKECANQEHDELPVVSVLKKGSDTIVFDGDVAMYDHKLGSWLVIDSIQKKDETFSADEYDVVAMCGKYVPQENGKVHFVSYTGKNVVKLPFDTKGFEQTTVTEEVDTYIINTLKD